MPDTQVKIVMVYLVVLAAVALSAVFVLSAIDSPATQGVTSRMVLAGGGLWSG
jgi:hypothetical protein